MLSPSKNLSREAEQQFRQLQQELQTAKEALAEMQRQAGGASRGSSVEVREGPVGGQCRGKGGAYRY